MSFTSRVAKGAAVVFGLGMAYAVSAADITGAGSTFVYPILSKWSSEYNAKTGSKINYQSIGSGGGIAQIKAGTVDFGASDAPLKTEDLQQAGLTQFPVVIGGVVPVVNIAGVEPGKLKLTGPVLADIFLGKITKWNDAAIASLNSGVALPEATINVVHRSDGSGTTFNFVNYLAKVSPEWGSKVGEGTSVPWPVGVGGKGNEGVAGYVKQLKNSIGYVELAYALQNKMSYVGLKNRAGKFVEPSLETFQAAAASAEWNKAKDFYLVITDAPGADSWPIAASVFVIMYKQPKDAERSKATLEFFKWAMENGQAAAKALDYVALPAPLVKQIETHWSSEIK
ncbi:phosphate ABC transporter substrate-binding protein PstS [Azoarcus sp. DN11]|uniref:phosphate ABC transporter substrate-binding protein PstS n=1 Tax=Azoarcus sp. DN11 TaxID=356837 RepID=UPI000EAF8B99|nr:phosphate ABC transporter substrate-binding protein PstS [Azoarcus sp. DN11]AYH42186.1 phosphate ABC transporter substrate-binding protein PstS [Azoarcus sp. DN11]